MCFCLKILYLACIVDLLTLNSGPTALSLTPEGSLPNTRVFSVRQVLAFLRLGTPRQHFLALHFGGYFKQQNYQQKRTQMQTVKRILDYRTIAKTRRRSAALFDLSWECVGRVTLIFPTRHMSASDHEY